LCYLEVRSTVTVDETLIAQPVMGPLETTSGVRIEPITAYAAKSFLKRLDEMDHVPGVVEAAWGAFTDVTLVGVGVLALRERPGEEYLWESPAIGDDSELEPTSWNSSSPKAKERDLTTLTCVHSCVDPGAQRLVQSLGLTTAWRVSKKTAVMVVTLSTQLPKRTEITHE
jgi:hypothetical protein